MAQDSKAAVPAPAEGAPPAATDARAEDDESATKLRKEAHAPPPPAHAPPQAFPQHQVRRAGPRRGRVRRRRCSSVGALGG